MSEDNYPKHFRRRRSFVRRDGRITSAQTEAYTNLWPKLGFDIANGVIDYPKAFGRDAKRFLEIGFGTGQSLIAAAQLFPECDFIGVETHKPGIGKLFLAIETHEINNIRVFYGDVIDVIKQSLPDEGLDGAHIFFPDPWQKRRHHVRRLIQPDFIKLILTKIKQHGELHLATDWENYAHHMMEVMSAEEGIINLAGETQFAERSPYRPIKSKFERRAEREGRGVWELRFRKK